MNHKLAQLAQRRRRLVSQAATQRMTLVRNIEPLRKPLATVDQGIRVVSYIKRHPVLAVGASALFGLLRHTKIGKWLQNGWSVFHVSRGLRDVLLKNKT